MATDDTKGINDDTKSINDDTKGINDDTKGINDDTKSINDDTEGINVDTKSINDDTEGINVDTKSINDDTEGINDATQQSDWKPKGYPRLAGLMANSTNLMIFRRFNNLNIFNLLSLQAELVDLEEQLRDRWEDDDIDEPEQRHSIFFKSLRKPTDTQENKEQWKLLLALVNPSGENDDFQRWISSKPLLWFHKHFFDPLKRKFLSKEKNRQAIVDEETGMVNYKDATLDRISIFVAVFIALGFLIGAIVALYFNKDTLQRIGIMAGFTTAFGLTLTFFTTAKRIEIFSSVAALVLPIKELRDRTK